MTFARSSWAFTSFIRPLFLNQSEIGHRVSNLSGPSTKAWHPHPFCGAARASNRDLSDEREDQRLAKTDVVIEMSRCPAKLRDRPLSQFHRGQYDRLARSVR